MTSFAGEQEFRAQVHILQLVSLASYLRRTLVFPRITASRFSACGSAPFDYFYDLSTFSESTGSSPILQRELEEWLATSKRNREQGVTAREIRLTVPGFEESSMR